MQQAIWRLIKAGELTSVVTEMYLEENPAVP
jgi:hypothetical protein